MQVQRYINGEKSTKLPKEIANEAVREVLSRAEARLGRKRHG